MSDITSYKDMERRDFEKREEIRHLLERHKELLDGIEERADISCSYIELLEIALCEKIEEHGKLEKELEQEKLDRKNENDMLWAGIDDLRANRDLLERR